MKVGIGMHWSSENWRLCINLVPCATIWIVGRGGVAPNVRYWLPRGSGP